MEPTTPTGKSVALILGLVTPEARDKVLLGFALAELPDEAHLFVSTKGGVVWGKDIPVTTGPTPLAAVRAALKDTVSPGDVYPGVARFTDPYKHG